MYSCFRIACLVVWKKSFYSSLAFLFACVLCVVFSFCDDHQFIDVSRCGNSSWSSGWWKFRCVAYLGSNPASSSFLLGLWLMYYLALWAFILNIVELLFCLVNGIVVCLSFLFQVFWIIVPSVLYKCKKWHLHSMTMPFYY